MTVKVTCDYCGKVFEKQHTRITAHNFCCLACKGRFSSKEGNPDGYAQYRDFSKAAKRMHDMNPEWNRKRMTPTVRKKLRESRLGTGEGKCYAKVYGRHEHRIVAEQILGRPLLPGEVVHHIDRDKRNNAPENLMVFPSQAAHAKWHKEYD